jgi:hypothetical protein
MAHYVSGYRYGRGVSANFTLSDAPSNLCDAVVLLLAEAPNASVALARAQLGWTLTRADLARHKPPGNPKYDAAPDHLPPIPDRADVDAATRADIWRRNARDVDLYAHASRLVARRIRMIS